MNENETFVTDTEEVVVAENVEQTTEESPKTYTEAEFNAKMDEVLSKKIARKEAKIRKEYERKYGDLEEVLKAGTGKENVDEITGMFREHYERKGVQFQQKPQYNDKDVEVLARADADDIIRGGFEDVVEEADRLKEIGVANMTAREKAVFLHLTNHIKDTETGRELSKIGVTEDVYGSKEYQDFAAKFNSSTSAREIYDLYVKIQPKKDIKTMGSMKNTASGDSTVKEYYSPEEAKKFTVADYNKNPALFKAVQESMRKWKK